MGSNFSYEVVINLTVIVILAPKYVYLVKRFNRMDSFLVHKVDKKSLISY